MEKIRYRDCRIGDVIEVTGPCRFIVESKSGRAPRVKIMTNQDNDISFSTVDQAHTCRDTEPTLNKGE